MGPTLDLDELLRAVASDPPGMVGEELLHEVGFDGTEVAIATAEGKGWIERDADDVYGATATGREVLDVPDAQTDATA